MKKLLCLLLCVLMLSGCTTHGTEEQLMVVILGVDQTEDGKIQLMVKAPSFSGGQDPSGSESNGYLTITAKADTFPAALAHLSTVSPRKLNYTQTRLIVINSAALRDQHGLIRSVSLIEGMRSQAAVTLCTQNVHSVIDAQKPVLGTRLSRYIDTTWETGIRAGYIPDSTLIRVQTKLLDAYQDALISRSEISLPAGASQSETAVRVSSSSDNQSGGQSGQEQNTVQWSGAAAMNGADIAGYLTGFETTLCRFLSKEIRAMPYEIDGHTVRLTARFGPRLSVVQKDGSLCLQIRATLNVLPQLGAQISLTHLQQALTDDISAMVSMLQSLQSDALGFGASMSHLLFDADVNQQAQWKTQYRDAAVEVRLSLILMDE